MARAPPSAARSGRGSPRRRQPAWPVAAATSRPTGWRCCRWVGAGSSRALRALSGGLRKGRAGAGLRCVVRVKGWPGLRRRSGIRCSSAPVPSPSVGADGRLPRPPFVGGAPAVTRVCGCFPDRPDELGLCSAEYVGESGPDVHPRGDRASCTARGDSRPPRRRRRSRGCSGIPWRAVWRPEEAARHRRTPPWAMCSRQLPGQARRARARSFWRLSCRCSARVAPDRRMRPARLLRPGFRRSPAGRSSLPPWRAAL
jgi:hypothetical protein